MDTEVRTRARDFWAKQAETDSYGGPYNCMTTWTVGMFNVAMAFADEFAAHVRVDTNKELADMLREFVSFRCSTLTDHNRSLMYDKAEALLSTLEKI